jgi:hypothetical protein
MILVKNKEIIQRIRCGHASTRKNTTNAEIDEIIK